MSSFFTPEQLVALRALNRISGCLSLVGGAAVISTYCVFERYHTVVNKLVFYYTVSDTIFSVMSLIGEAPFSPDLNQPFCTAQGALIVFSNFASILWSCCMSLQCLLAVSLRKKIRDLNRYHVIYHSFVWGTSIFMAILFFVPLGGFVHAVAYFYFAHVTIDTSKPVASALVEALSSVHEPL
ncbi:glycolytic proteins transcriptional activator gcr1 [Cladochytrium tenue]|nr:glycolytic proteins transcriptional activator gcr1 [Cladochytrium tenue]